MVVATEGYVTLARFGSAVRRHMCGTGSGSSRPDVYFQLLQGVCLVISLANHVSHFDDNLISRSSTPPYLP